MKKNLIKMILFVILFTGFAAYSFGETIYNISMSLTRMYEQYTDENSGRDFDGISFDGCLIGFPGKSPFGWYLKTSIGWYFSGTEWKDDSVAAADIFSATDIRLSTGPSFTLRAGSNFQIPILIGPVISNYREEIYDYYYDYDSYCYDYNDISGFYEAITVGALCDVGVVLTSFNRFTITTGVTVNWDFLRWEKGFNAEMAYRTVNSGSFNSVNYNALKVSLYFGVGLRFDDSKVVGLPFDNARAIQ